MKKRKSSQMQRFQLDDLDYKILDQLCRDESPSYMSLEKSFGISAAAIHERVKKMKKSGVIKGTVALIDYSKLGPLFLAFVLLKIEGEKEKEIDALSLIPEIEGIDSIAGEYSLLIKVRTRDTDHMELVFSKLYSIPGILGSQTIISFKTYLHRQVVV